MESEPAGGTSQVPSISLPKGGGAIRGIGEKFAANPVTGTGSMTVPIVVTPGRSGLAPQLTLSYDSGSGNGPFGLGWNLSLPAITRKTDKGLPKYRDADESDVFILSGAEDLVPALDNNGKIAEEDRNVFAFDVTARASKDCLRASRDGRISKPAKCAGAPFQKTTSPRSTARRPKVALPIPTIRSACLPG
jgi:Salmonella virulence plasmid 65kDa B protein